MKSFTLLLCWLALLPAGLFAQTETPMAPPDGFKVKVDTLLTGLRVPWGLAFLPNGDLLFTERGGELRLIQEDTLHPDPIAHVPEVRAKGQGGLLDVTLHPDYAENGWLYLAYSEPGKVDGKEVGTTTFIRARLREHALVDIQEVFSAEPMVSQAHHYGGRIAFDREGYLYLSVGDRGGREVAQSLDNHRGKIFRLHDDGQVPEDNPFADQTGAMPEIFSYGHRNPQGLEMNPATGSIWSHEHGPKGGDEVNYSQAGHNYGWPTISYGRNYDGTILTEETHREGMEQPLTCWVPSIAPCGMEFITSDRYGPWKGDLLVGSLKFRRIERVMVKGDTVTGREIILENLGRIRALTQGPDGLIYVAVEGPGMIVRLVPEQ